MADLNTAYNTNDTPSSRLGTAYVKIKEGKNAGKRYRLFNAQKVEAVATVETAEVKVLGDVITRHKAVGVTYKITMTVYKVSDMFDDFVQSFARTGVMPTFDLQVTEYDPATTIGTSGYIYRNCVIDGDIRLAGLDVDGTFIGQEITCYASGVTEYSAHKEPAYWAD
ncbi:MAG: hypothetical protein IIZ66_05575 [Clostridia bacterium]|nr:hypothetical protein [Clostridia bacterium]